MKKILVTFGTRPEATKMCPLVLELKKYPEWFDVKLVVTGQHTEQLQQPLDNFGLVPDINLKIMKKSQTLEYVTSAVLNGLKEVIDEDRPDMIIVHGDTQTSFSGALVGYFNKIPVAHIEAGLRSFDKYSPWPEEVNRKTIDIIADILFPPTQTAKKHIIEDNLKQAQIYVSGQTAIDAALIAYKDDYVFSDDYLNTVDFGSERIIYVTAHRRENYGEKMDNMFRAIRRVVDGFPDVRVIYPIHLSPAVREQANEHLSNHDRIHMIEPIDFFDNLNLIGRSHMIMTDSGGIQEEAGVFDKPLILMRDTTERPEAVEAGTIFLGGTDEDVLFDAAKRMLTDQEYYDGFANAKNPFGDGQASRRIAYKLAHYFRMIDEPLKEF